VPEIKDVVSELQFISDRLSTQVRTVALGLLAISWTILVGDSAFLRSLAEGLGKSLLGVAILCVLALFLDFLQYVAGYAYVKRALAAAEKNESKEVDYDPDSFLIKLRSFLFWVKQLATIATLAIFLYSFVRYLYF